MGWEITDIRIIEDAGNASVFQFEAAVGDAHSRRLMAGDGFIRDDGRVHINRQAELRRKVASAGLDPEGFLHRLSEMVSYRRMAAAGGGAA